jgi:competence protein ComEC
VHTSWFVAIFCGGVVAGVMGAQLVDGWVCSAMWLMASVLLLIVALWRHAAYALVFVAISGCMIGLWRGNLGRQALAPYKSLVGYNVTISGSVTEDPDVGKSGELLLRLGSLKSSEHDLAGMIWVSADSNADIKRADLVTVKGKLIEGFGNFAGSIYRAEIAKVQRPQPGDIAGRFRDWFADGVRKAIPEPEASLGIGYLVGQRRSLPPELDSALKIVGLTHVVVASGYNLTILVRLARRLFVKVSKYLAALSAGSMILLFMAVTGLSPSMSRAGLVAGLSLLVWYYGRKFHPLVLLPFAAAITLLINPSYGWNDLGWQLSFAAFAGVMIVAPLLQAYFFGDKKPGTVRQILGETVSAQICTLPILVLAFGQFSNVAIVANLLVLPFVPLAMLLTFISGVGALLIPAYAAIFGAPASWLLQYMTTVTQYLAQIPWAQTQADIQPWMLGAAYFGIVLVCVYMWRKTKFNFRGSNIIE